MVNKTTLKPSVKFEKFYPKSIPKNVNDKSKVAIELTTFQEFGRYIGINLLAIGLIMFIMTFCYLSHVMYNNVWKPLKIRYKEKMELRKKNKRTVKVKEKTAAATSVDGASFPIEQSMFL